MERKQQESKLKKEQKGVSVDFVQPANENMSFGHERFGSLYFSSIITAFDTKEEKKIQEELEAYNAALEEEMEREKQRHQRNLEALNARKEEMIKEKKQKIKVHLLYCHGHILPYVFM